jgi:hypothetical protein
MRYANQKNLSISADNQSTSTLEYINWQSDTYTLIEDPQVRIFFILTKPVNSIYKPSITNLKFRLSMGISGYVTI